MFGPGLSLGESQEARAWSEYQVSCVSLYLEMGNMSSFIILSPPVTSKNIFISCQAKNIYMQNILVNIIRMRTHEEAAVVISTPWEWQSRNMMEKLSGMDQSELSICIT